MCGLTQGCVANKELHFPDSGDMLQTRLSALRHPSCFELHSNDTESRIITVGKLNQQNSLPSSDKGEEDLFWKRPALCYGSHKT